MIFLTIMKVLAHYFHKTVAFSLVFSQKQIVPPKINNGYFIVTSFYYFLPIEFYLIIIRSDSTADGINGDHF